MNDILKKCLTILGDIKVFKYPFYMVYDPGSYKLTGKDCRDILTTLQVGDIILRGYQHYLDGYLIPGQFSHVAFYSGNNTVIHVMAEGVLEEDILTFMRCDYIAILRYIQITEEEIWIAVENAKSLLGKEYDFDFKSGNDKLYCCELVLEAYKHKRTVLQITEEEISYLGGLIKRQAITPDSFLFSPGLQIVYSSIISTEKIKKESFKRCAK